MQTSRRKFMMILGGGVVVAAGAAGGWAATRDPVAARMPWAVAQALDVRSTDPRIYALSHAILAPNPHNRQPWVADLAIENEITLYCDLDRRLPHTDPFDRQITIGLGCFSELLIMAAAAAGFGVETEWFPEGEAQPRLDDRAVARLRFSKDDGVATDPLFAHVFDRRSNKEPWDATRNVAEDHVIRIAGAAGHGQTGFTLDAGKVARLRELSWEAMEIELHTYRTAKESIDLLRVGKAEIEANPDGIDLSGPFFEALDVIGMMDRETMLDTSSTLFREQIKALREPFDTAPGFIWLSTPANTRADQIAAGRGYIRLNLAATGMGIAMQPFSQALQEYKEMASMFVTMRETLGIEANDTLQMFARIGYGPQITASPRWPAETRIMI